MKGAAISSTLEGDVGVGVSVAGRARLFLLRGEARLSLAPLLFLRNFPDFYASAPAGATTDPTWIRTALSPVAYK